MTCTCNQHSRKQIVTNGTLAYDPTRTLTLRNRFSADMSARLRKLKAAIRRSVITNDCFGLKETRPITLQQEYGGQDLTPIPYQAFRFDRDPQKVEKFMAWLAQQEQLGLLELVPGDQLGVGTVAPWTNMYIQTAYQKGVARAITEMKKAGIPVPDVPLSAAFNQPFHIDRVGLMFTRTFNELKGVTEAINQQMSRELAQGIADGINPRQLARKLTDAIDLPGIGNVSPKVRADLIARTETIRAHHVATIQEYKNAGVEEVKILAEFTTAGDSRVCQRCKDIADGGPYTLEQIEPMIPVHPRCRCIALPLDVTDEEEE